MVICSSITIQKENSKKKERDKHRQNPVSWFHVDPAASIQNNI